MRSWMRSEWLLSEPALGVQLAGRAASLTAPQSADVCSLTMSQTAKVRARHLTTAYLEYPLPNPLALETMIVATIPFTTALQSTSTIEHGRPCPARRRGMTLAPPRELTLHMLSNLDNRPTFARPWMKHSFEQSYLTMISRTLPRQLRSEKTWNHSRPAHCSSKIPGSIRRALQEPV